ncbi:hypothetical protein ACOMHN_067380 [Nucella lapillus]
MGPADYMETPLNLTRYQSPEWSILNRHIYNYKGMKNPPPNKYLIPDTVTLKNNFTLGKKLKPNKKVIAGACKAGPTYMVKGHETGRNAPKYSMPRAPRNDRVTGPPNHLVTPADTPGFRTPGAEVFSEDGILPHSRQAQIFSRPKEKVSSGHHPAPNKYTPSTLDPGLMKTIIIIITTIIIIIIIIITIIIMFAIRAAPNKYRPSTLDPGLMKTIGRPWSFRPHNLNM